MRGEGKERGGEKRRRKRKETTAKQRAPRRKKEEKRRRRNLSFDMKRKCKRPRLFRLSQFRALSLSFLSPKIAPLSLRTRRDVTAFECAWIRVQSTDSRLDFAAMPPAAAAAVTAVAPTPTPTPSAAALSSVETSADDCDTSSSAPAATLLAGFGELGRGASIAARASGRPVLWRGRAGIRGARERRCRDVVVWEKQWVFFFFVSLAERERERER